MAPSPPSPNHAFPLPRALPWLAVLALPLLLLAFTRVGVVDDAYISFRYARNLVSGRGYAFNPGDPVEGATNLLWTLLMAVPIGLGLPEHLAAAALGLAFGLLAAVQGWRLARALGAGERAAFLALATLGLCPDFWLMATNGLAGGLYAALLTQTLLAAVTGASPAVVGVWATLLFATRPDAVGLLPLLGIYLAAVPVRGPAPGPPPARRLATFAAVLVAGIGALTMWRFVYFGAALPNSIAAKSVLGLMSPTHGPTAWWRGLQLIRPSGPVDVLTLNLKGGVRYVLDFVVATLPLSAGAVLAPVLRPRRAGVWLGAAASAAGAAVAVANGGDWMPAHRLIAPYLPVMAALLAVAIDAVAGRVDRWAPSARRAAQAAGAAALAAAVVVMGVRNQPRDNTGGWRATPALEVSAPASCYASMGRVFEAALPPDAVAASLVAGVFGYELRGHVVHDMLGLTDRYLAEHGGLYWPTLGRSDFAYTYDRVRPAVTVLHRSGLPPGAVPAGDGYRTFAHTAGGCNELVLLRADLADALLPLLAPLHLEPVTPP
ncbi:MAG: hypothetical protein AB7O93_12480 [Vicinamibacterales bacterium]